MASPLTISTPLPPRNIIGVALLQLASAVAVVLSGGHPAAALALLGGAVVVCLASTLQPPPATQGAAQATQADHLSLSSSPYSSSAFARTTGGAAFRPPAATAPVAPVKAAADFGGSQSGDSVVDPDSSLSDAASDTTSDADLSAEDQEFDDLMRKILGAKKGPASRPRPAYNSSSSSSSSIYGNRTAPASNAWSGTATYRSTTVSAEQNQGMQHHQSAPRQSSSPPHHHHQNQTQDQTHTAAKPEPRVVVVAPPAGPRLEGTIVVLKENYGFIRQDGFHSDWFFHISELQKATGGSAPADQIPAVVGARVHFYLGKDKKTGRNLGKHICTVAAQAAKKPSPQKQRGAKAQRARSPVNGNKGG